MYYSAILISWFLMNYKGRVLEQITDRMVSYNSLSCLYSWIFHTSLSQYFITLWSQTSSVFPPRHSNTTNPCRAFVVLSMSSLFHLHCSFFQESARWTWLQSENLAEVGLLLGLSLGLMVFLFVPNTNHALPVLVLRP